MSAGRNLSVVCRHSVVCVEIISEPIMHGFLSTFDWCFPSNFLRFFLFVLKWVSVTTRAKNSKRYYYTYHSRNFKLLYNIIMGTFSLVAFRVILGSFGAFAIFPKIRFQKKKKKRKENFFYKSQPKFITLLLNYFLNGPHKSKIFFLSLCETWSIIKVLKNWIIWTICGHRAKRSEN